MEFQLEKESDRVGWNQRLALTRAFIPTIRLSDDVHSKTEKKHDIEPNESRQKRKNILREPMNIYFSPFFHIAKVLRGVCGDGGLLEQ